MSQSSQKTKKLTLIPLILMIFTSVFGFANMPRSFYLMGYGAIPWYILSGITFFIPYAFMMAEYGAAFKDEKGGIYSWMEKSVGGKYAFVGTFMWYASYIIWILFVTFTASKVLEKITKVTSIGGTAVALLNIVLLVSAIIVLILNGGELSEPITSAQSFVKSPNPAYQSPISVLAFIVFAIFGYGGIEVVGGLVDKKHLFPLKRKVK